MRVAMAQLRIDEGEAKGNMERATAMVGKASSEGANLIVFPELFATGVVENPLDFAQDPDGETVGSIRELASSDGIGICGSYIESNGGDKPYNTTIVADESGRVVCSYRKSHLFTGHGEETAYAAGDSISTFDLSGLTFCPLICYDLRFAPLFYSARSRGVNAFLVTANWPEKRIADWSQLLSARALETRSYVIGVNCSGEGSHGPMGGSSAAYGPDGRLLAACEGDDSVAVIDLDPDIIDDMRAIQDPFCDLRWDMYDRVMGENI